MVLHRSRGPVGGVEKIAALILGRYSLFPQRCRLTRSACRVFAVNKRVLSIAPGRAKVMQAAFEASVKLQP